MTDQDRQPQAEQDRQEFSAESGSLWRLTIAPTTWAVHLILCYSTVSLACWRGLFPIYSARYWLIGASVVALAFIALQGWRAQKQWGDQGTDGQTEDRHRFLGHATFLIAVISGIGTVFTTLPLFLLEGCR